MCPGGLLFAWHRIYIIAACLCLALVAGQARAEFTFRFNLINGLGKSEQRELSASSQGYFQANPRQTDYSGICMLWSLEETCRFTSMPANVTTSMRSIRQSRDYPTAAVLLSWQHAYAMGCRTYAQVATAAANFGATLPADAFPPLKLLILALSEDGTAGPQDRPYRARQAGVPDGPPDMDTAFINNADTGNIVKLTQASGGASLILFAARYTAGEWNAALFSGGYVAFCWILFVLLVGVSLYTIMRLVILWFRRRDFLRRGVHMVIYAIGVPAALLTAVVQVMFGETYLRATLEQVASLLTIVSLLLMIYLWGTRLGQVYPGPVAKLLRYHVLLSAAVTLAQFAVNMCLLHTSPTEADGGINAAYESLENATTLVIPGIQLFLASVFVIFAARFAHGWYHFYLARGKFGELFLLSLIGCFSFLALGVTGVVNASASGGHLSVAVFTALAVLRQLAILTRAMAVLCVYGLRPPTRTAMSNAWRSRTRESLNGHNFTDTSQQHSVASTISSYLSSENHQSLGKLPLTGRSIQPYMYGDDDDEEAGCSWRSLSCMRWHRRRRLSQQRYGASAGISSTDLLQYQISKQHMLTVQQTMHSAVPTEFLKQPAPASTVDSVAPILMDATRSAPLPPNATMVAAAAAKVHSPASVYSPDPPASASIADDNTLPDPPAAALMMPPRLTSQHVLPRYDLTLESIVEQPSLEEITESEIQIQTTAEHLSVPPSQGAQHFDDGNTSSDSELPSESGLAADHTIVSTESELPVRQSTLLPQLPPLSHMTSSDGEENRPLSLVSRTASQSLRISRSATPDMPSRSRHGSISSITSKELFQAHPNKYL
ncbi:hypothetical protein THASP1DRAFT_28566 [Thamnocephalis sphaerospora]|uniref:TRP C-terminal domain-containing protein n=1 Tax=Thamnocephalis sphaerospora TaxID=78915 RepID=A0A4P9XUL3_9FUNG|nr:hypothetical protein THASP1DRAFT_28566 [Thamnocephalis sphaerospora]|eukprot:RKP09652.1 hypothetical protein THASP1DRAFT_28566 [Thamnocephalis sphaerospora]